MYFFLYFGDEVMILSLKKDLYIIKIIFIYLLVNLSKLCTGIESVFSNKDNF